jgi:hypothetical protein
MEPVAPGSSPEFGFPVKDEPMAMDGLLVLTCAVVIAAPPAPAPTSPPTERPSAIDNTLAVQLAMGQAKSLLDQKKAKQAVTVLEGHLSRINGNAAYLSLLRDAYLAYLKDMWLDPAAKDASAVEKEHKKYLERLAILDPDAARDKNLTAARAPGKPVPRKTAAPAPVKPYAVIRMQKSEESSAHAAGENKGVGDGGRIDKPLTPSGREEKRAASPARDTTQEAARRLLTRAREEFDQGRFASARLLFDEAQRIDKSVANRVTANSRDQWAYCKLHHVVEQLKRKDADQLPWADLESEVRLALTLSGAAQLEQSGKEILHEIQKRRLGTGRKTGSADAPVAVKIQHLERNRQGWYVAETANFRIFHKQDRELVDKVARTAEETRAAMTRKWFGKAGADWKPKCSIYLHDTAREYSQITGISASSPGHSRIETESERVVSRQIDVRCDHPGMLKSVLPHETTHVVLAGQFGNKPVPRWADEGMAVLTEPRDKLALHKKNLARSRQDGQLFAVRDLMELSDYPKPRLIGAFYAQSVSLVDYLTRQRGAVIFSQFLREAQRDGYEPALKKFYHFRNFADLEASWSEHAFGKVGSLAAKGG